jgi:hypothetical protein
MRRTIILAALISLSLVTLGRGDDGDETLRYYLSRSPLVVVAEIQSTVITGNNGVMKYSCFSTVLRVLKGNFKDKTMRPSIERFEAATYERPAYLNWGSHCIFFLKPDAQGQLASVDPWFGVEPYSDRLANSLSRLSQGDGRMVPGSTTQPAAPGGN